MRVLQLATILAAGLLVPASAFASICPTTGSTNTDCAFILTIGSGGTVTGSTVAGALPYDGSDDALVGIVNNSGAAFSGSIPLSGTGDGGGIFAFEGDGICSYVSASYCSTAPTGYEGPGVTFASIIANGTSGNVVVSNLAAGSTTYFSLESSPASINGGGGLMVGGQTPEPSSIMLLGTGVLGLSGALRRKFARICP